MIAVRLALREIRHEWLAAACFVAALVGVLLPLLVILALKNGMIGGMVDRLLLDPNSRELIAIGTGRHDAAFFEAFSKREDVSFLMPATRSINALADAVRNPANRKLERAVSLIPSAAGDPLIVGAEAATAGEAWVSAALGAALGVETGGEIELVIGREIDGSTQSVRRKLAVIGVIDPEIYGREAILLSLPDLLAIERFRDDETATKDNWLEDSPAPEFYASFRLYTRDLADLTVVQAALKAVGVDSRLRAANASLLLSFRKTLNQIYGLIAGLAIFGFWAAMAANLRGMVERQRVAFSLLRLLGAGAVARHSFPVIQCIVLISCGLSLSLLLMMPATTGLNAAFSSASDHPVAVIYFDDILKCIGLGLFTALTASIWASYAIGMVYEDEVLRNG